ncbi:MAG: HAD family hydrolase [Myxococcota bacterium]
MGSGNMMMRGILFDLDNTLIDRDAAMRRAVTRCLGVDAEDAIDEVLAHDDSGFAERRAFFGWLAFRHPVFGGDARAAWKTLADGMRHAIEPDTAANDLIDALATDYRLALVTNGGSATQRHKLRRSGLDRRFEHIFISEEVGCKKPQAGIFENALRALDCSPDNAIFVGDNPMADVAGAAAVGMRTCWVARGRDYPASCPQPTWTVQHVARLSEVLAC